MRLVPVMLSLALLGGCLAETDASEVEALEAELEDSKPPAKAACETPPCTHDLAYYRQHPEAWLASTVTRAGVSYDFEWLTCTAEECGLLDDAGWALASELTAAALNLQQLSTTVTSVDGLLHEATYMMGDCYFDWGGSCEAERVPALTSAVKAFNEGHTSVLGESCGSALGACRSGTIQCGEGGLVCTGKVPLAEEICGNRLDDDCNGLTDDACGCVHEIPANGVDDDCDGTLDEPLGKTIYVNGQGGTFHPGVLDSSINNVAYLVPATAHVPAFSGGAEAFRQIMACVAKAYAAFDVVVTDVDPSPLPHVEVVVGGLGSDAGTSDQAGGMAVPTCAPTGDAVVFVFSELYGQDFTEVCNTIAHEAGHSYGLNHEVVAQDLMSYAFVSDKSFQDTASDCGETFARPCMCGGQKQNSHAHLLSLLSPRSQPEGVPAPEAEGPAALHESVEHVNGATPLRSSVQATGASQRLGICATPH